MITYLWLLMIFSYKYFFAHILYATINMASNIALYSGILQET